LGPKAFIAYTEYVDSVFSAHHMAHHGFADDIQAHTHTMPSQVNTIVPSLQDCIADVADWCGSRRLQLNAIKTEFMWFGSSAALNNLSHSDNDITRWDRHHTTSNDGVHLSVHLDS